MSENTREGGDGFVPVSNGARNGGFLPVEIFAPANTSFAAYQLVLRA